MASNHNDPRSDSTREEGRRLVDADGSTTDPTHTTEPSLDAVPKPRRRKSKPSPVASTSSSLNRTRPMDTFSSAEPQEPLAIAEEAQVQLAEADRNTQAIVNALRAIVSATSVETVIQETLDTIRSAFDWIYGSYWRIDAEQERLVFDRESGNVDAEFRELTRSASFRRGEGLNGRVWRRGEAVYIKDLGDLRDCCRAPVARRAGIQAAVCLPITKHDQLIGTMDFFSEGERTISEMRLSVLETIAQTASDKIAILDEQAELCRIQAMVENASINVMYVDNSGAIRYLNRSATHSMTSLRDHLSVVNGRLLGQPVEVFYSDPAGGDCAFTSRERLPRGGVVRLGPEILDVRISPISDRQGNFIGAMLSWETITTRYESDQREAELVANTSAVNQVLIALSKAVTPHEIVHSALEVVANVFGWAYGSYWQVDEEIHSLVFVQETGQVDEEFQSVTRSAQFREGEGLNGRAWRRRDMVFVEDIGSLADCCRAPVAQRAGVLSAVAFPLQVDGKVIGTLDFFAKERLELADSRREALQNVGRLISSSLERAKQRDQIEAAAINLESKVNQLTQVARSAAAGDLTVTIPQQDTDSKEDSSGTMRQLEDSVTQMIGDLRSLISEVVDSANQFTEASQVIAESATYLSDSSQSQAATVEEMSASVEQLNRAIQQISSNAELARQQAEKSRDMARQGGEAVDQAVEAMSLIKRSSEHVSEIIQVISEIASQTNLLALNAAIEAARAGEHGLGFAVVADEVRKLAERSSAAAKEIRSLIKESTSRVADGAQLSVRAGESLATIVQGVDQTADSIASIAEATREQSQSAEEVNRAIQDVSTLTETNASSSEELSASAGQLGTQAESLKQLISRFKLS